MQQLSSYRKHCQEILYLSIFRKSDEKIKFHYTMAIVTVLYMKSYIHLWYYVADSYL